MEVGASASIDATTFISKNLLVGVEAVITNTSHHHIGLHIHQERDEERKKDDSDVATNVSYGVASFLSCFEFIYM